jgi:hypothetical protein
MKLLSRHGQIEFEILLYSIYLRRKHGPYSQLIHELRQASSGRIALQILLVRDTEYEFKINSYGVASQAV